jgi:23S rRNA G2069 N7-methylase RlmK/C1962 C5-methylase RlmI
VKSEIDSDLPGLSLNQRLHRNWVRNHSRNKSVLNLFASTCTYSVAAALGQASQVISVELNKKALSRGRKNFELNQLSTESAQFLCRDSLTYLKQSLQKNRTYDLILCEVPSFFRREKGVFRIENDLEELLRNCLESLSAKGMLLVSIQHEGLFIDDIRKIMAQVQKKLGLSQLEINCILPSLDFELPGQKTQLKSFLVASNEAPI